MATKRNQPQYLSQRQQFNFDAGEDFINSLPDNSNQKKKEEPGNFARGFKKSMYQIPQTIGGTIGLAGDVLGADGMRDYGMGIYENNTKKVEELTRDSDSISNVMEGNGSFGDWLSSGAGYVGGQALSALATGGVGALVGKQLASRGVRHMLENQLEKEAAKQAISKGAKVGAASAAFGSNLVQEAGSIYPEALQEAQKNGVELTAGDLARVIATSSAAAGVDTLSEALIANKFLGGGRRAITNSAGEQVSESVGRAALREVPLGMAKEAGTEGVQTAIERYGANQDLSSKEAIRDYVDSAALGALGGAGGGVASSFTKQRLPETGPLTRSLNAGIDVENATLQTSSQNPATQNIDPQNPATQPSADLPATQNNPAQQFTGMDELISAVQNEDNPSLVREITQRQTQQQMDHPSQIEGMPANFSEVLQQSNQQREQDRIETRGTWEDAKEQAALELAEQDRIEQENRLRLPAPDMPMPEGALIDDNGTLRQQTYQDAAAAQVAAAQREELGQPVPYGERGGIENVSVPSSPSIPEEPVYILHPSGKPFTNKIGAQSRLKQLGGNHTIVPYEGGFAIQNNDPQEVTQAQEQQAASGVPDATAGSAQPEPVAIQPGDIMHPSGKPFANKYPAVMTQRQSGGEIIKVDGGYIVRPPKQASLEEIVAESQSEPTYEKGKTGAETARNKLDAENPFLSFLGKYGLNIEERSDVGGERGKARLIPGHGPLFRKNGLRLDELAQVAKEAGFLSQEQIDSDTDNGGVNALADMIGQALNNEVVPKVQSAPEVNPDAEMLNEAKRVGLDVTGKTPDQVYDMVKAYHDQVSQSVAAEVVSEVPATTNESAQVDVDNGQISMRKTPEEISLELQKLTDAVRERTKNFDLSFDDGNEINFMTPEEKSYRHELLSQLPSSGEEQLQAKKRIEEKIAARREAKATDGVQADADLEWNTAVDLFNDLSLEAQELAREYNLHELYFDIEELENAKTNDARSEGQASEPVARGAIETEKIDRSDNETSAKQAEGVDAAEAGSQEAIGGEAASKPSGADNATVNSIAPSMESSSKETDQGTALFSRSNTLGETIEVDGVERPTTNSNGKPIAATEEGIKNFWRWFGDSKVVDADGKPMVVYHGTKQDFNEFSPAGEGAFGRGIYLSGIANRVKQYWGGYGDTNQAIGGNVLPVYLKIDKPSELTDVFKVKPTDKESANKYTALQQRLIKQGFDGSISWMNDKVWEAVAFSPLQIKSTTGNNGDFDGANPDIRYSKTQESGQRSKFGFDVDELQPIVDQISSTWKNKPKINIVQTIDDLPFDAPNDARGAYFKKQVYLVAANLRDQAQAEAVLFHETLGHAGLNEFFGKDLAPALRSIAMKNRKIAEAAAVWRKGNTDIKGNMSDDRYHLVSIEEALADYVGTGRTINGVEKLLAAIQKGLRAIGLNKIADWMENATDAEVLSMLASARKHVEKGADFSVFGEQQAQAFSRDEKNALSTDTKIEDGNPKALFSRSVITGDNSRTRTPEQLRAFENVGRTVQIPTLKERFNKMTENLGKKLAQGIVDQFAPIKDLSAEAYGLMRLSKGASGAFEAMLKGGQLKLSDGVYDFDEAKRGGVVDRLLVPLQGESDDFMWWVAGNRAEALSAQGKEHLFTTDDIKAFKSLSDGQASFDYTIQHGLQKGKTTRDRAIIYADSLKTFNEFNKNTLDMAEQSGLIDPDSRKIWESEFYIPFYRVSEESDDGVRGMNVKSGVVRQQAFKKLKGGTDKLNSDLLENTLMNWAHLLDASAKNRAAKSTLEAAENVGAAMPAMSGDKKTVWYMDNGEKKYFTVEDVHLLAAIQGLEYAGMRNAAMDGMTKMKHIVTMSITASPFFKTKNLIRDSISAIALADINYNPVTNIKEGWKLTDPKSDDYFRMLAGGGTIHFGSMLEGNESKRIRKLIDSGVDESTILKGWDSVASKFGKVWDAYNELGNRGETINRASLYNQLIKKGVSHAEASLQARDMMDFSMQGSWTIIRALTQVVPFMNARLQGLYKLGKSAKEDPKRFGTVLGAVAMSSIALMLAYADDDDWKKREDWDRDTFWWFKFGGTAFRIPKPFEIGAIGTLAERGIEYFTQDEMTGERFIKRFKTLLLDNLSMNPTPQLFKPIIDIYANKDSFTDRPIESMSMERLQSDYRFNGTTSMPARAISTTGNAISGNHFLSPVQVDHLIRGYFGWLGTAVVGTADRIVRLVDNEPARATIDRAKWLTGGMVSDLSSAQSRYVTQMYEQTKVLDEAYGTWRMLIKTGKVEEAKEFAEDNADKLRRYKGLQNVKKQATSLNEQVRVIERSNLDADEKREKINLIQQRKDNIARRASL